MPPSTLLLAIAIVQLCQSSYAQEGEKMTFTLPKVTEEEQHSMHIPSNMVCDACTAITYQIAENLKKAESKKNGKPLTESEYIDLFEKICHPTTYNDYGIKDVNGVNRISGEGLEAKDVAGMMQGGGKWPGRLAEKCGSIIGEIGEDELYAEFREKKGDLFDFICKISYKDCVESSKKEEL